MSEGEQTRRTRRKQATPVTEATAPMTTEHTTTEVPEPSAATTAMMKSILSEDDIYLFNQGTHYRLYNKFGAQPVTIEGVPGTYFAVWA
ncbi:MAG: 1,4-alpha-glucan branching enzyme, partial [Chloroflexi bacterium]